MTFANAQEFDEHKAQLLRDRETERRMWEERVKAEFPDLSPRRRRQILAFAVLLIAERETAKSEA